MASRKLTIKAEVDAKQAKREFKSTAKGMEDLGKRGKDSANKINKGYAQISNSVRQFGTQSERVSRNVATGNRNMVKGMNAYSKSVANANRNVRQLQGSLKNVRGGINAAAGGEGADGSLAGGALGSLTAGAVGGQIPARLADFKRMRDMGMNMQTSLKVATSNLNSFAVKAGVAGVAAFALFKTIKGGVTKGSDFSQLKTAFDNLASSVGMSGEKILASLRETSRGTVSDMELMRAAGTAALMGVPFDTFTDMMEIARATSRITGQTVTEAFNNIALASARQSKEIIDNLGITISLEEAQKNYAKELDTTVDKLTDAERKQAFINEAMNKGGDIIKRIGSEAKNTREIMISWGIMWDNLIANITSSLHTTFFKALELISYWLTQSLIPLQKFNAYIEDLGRTAQEATSWIPGLTDLFKYIGDEAEGDAKSVQGLRDAIADFNKEIALALLQDEKAGKRSKLGDLGGGTDDGPSPEAVNAAKATADRIFKIRREMQVKLFDLSGNARQAEIIATRQQFEDLQKEAVTSGAALAELEEVKRLEILAINAKYDELEKAQRDKAADDLETENQRLIAKAAELKDAWKEANPFLAWIDEAESFNTQMQEIAVSASEQFASGFSNAFMEFAEGTKSAGDAFKDFAKSFLSSVAKMIVQALALKAVKAVAGGLGGFFAAEGGVISGSFEPVQAFANGGVVSKPTLGMVGEGSESEAIIPLSKLDKMLNNSGGGMNSVVNVTVNNQGGGAGGGDMTKEQASNLSTQIKNTIAATIKQEMVTQKRAGGLLNKYNSRTN